MTAPRILIVDDEKNVLSSLSLALRVEGFEPDVAGNAAIALEKAKAKSYDAILLDVQLPDLDGLSLLRTMKGLEIAAPMIVMSGHGTIETAISATRLGAVDFLEKPVSTDRLLLTLRTALRLGELENENAELRKRSGVFDALLGDSATMSKLRERIELAARSSASVLVHGDRGTGKELVARAIHSASKRAKGPLEKLNCAAVPAELIESELFGHEAGAFTGATKQRRGKFERAHKGTLFLDEVGDMPAAMQSKLLRVLQEGEIERVGGSELIKLDVRVVAASNKDLAVEVKEGRFRADLLDRLNVLPISVPALRERRDDLPLLAAHFLELSCRANDLRKKSLSPGAMRVLEGYDFPGNVRELRNLVERLVILTPGDVVTELEARALVPRAGGERQASFYRAGAGYHELVEDAERAILESALLAHEGNMSKTAAALGLERSHLYKKAKALGLRGKGDDE